MNQIPPIFSEKRNYQTTWMTDNQVTVAIVTTLLFGVPIISSTDDNNLIGVNAQEVLDKIIPMCVINDATVRSSILSHGKTLTDNDIKVYMRYRENNVAGVEINISPDVIKQTIPVYTTYMEVKCEKECVVVKENIDEQEVASKRSAYTTRTLEKRQRRDIR
jgi:hypothetical protein